MFIPVDVDRRVFFSQHHIFHSQFRPVGIQTIVKGLILDLLNRFYRISNILSQLLNQAGSLNQVQVLCQIHCFQFSFPIRVQK